MTVSKILKTADSDLISSNVKQGADIFGVAGNYGGFSITNGLNFTGANAYVVIDNDGETLTPFITGKFYDDGTKIIGMCAAVCNMTNFAYSFAYFEIDKSTLQITRYPTYNAIANDGWGNIGTITMKYANVSGTNRYGMSSSILSKAVYFDGTSVVLGTHATIAGGTTVGTSTLSFLSKTFSYTYYSDYRDGATYSTFGSVAGLFQWV